MACGRGGISGPAAATWIGPVDALGSMARAATSARADATAEQESPSTARRDVPPVRSVTTRVPSPPDSDQARAT
jgi:hypothetical protein